MAEQQKKSFSPQGKKAAYARYQAEGHLARNKKLRAEKQAKFTAWVKRTRAAKTPRGSARAERRLPLQGFYTY